MKDTIRHKLDNLADRYEEISALLSEPEVQNDQNKFRSLSQEFSQLDPVVNCYRQFRDAELTLDDARTLLEDSDEEVRQLAKEEITETEESISALEHQLQILLLPKDPNDSRNVYVEVRAGTGGAEAALFASDLARMYMRYSETQNWQVEMISESPGELGGYKEVVMRVAGNGAYSRFKFESGTHRVQRVPDTESQGRIHTSACTVAIMPEADEIDSIEINQADLRIDTYRSSGAGGQHVNKTDSAIRITHLPTGIVVECQDERSQHKNRARAMSLLSSRLLAAEQEKQNAEIAQNRKSQVGSGDRSERIRTYNFPQGRMTDHRINLTLYKLDDIMQGNLDQIIDPLLNEYQAELLTALTDEN